MAFTKDLKRISTNKNFRLIIIYIIGFHVSKAGIKFLYYNILTPYIIKYLTHSRVRFISTCIIGFQITKTMTKFAYHHFLAKYRRQDLVIREQGRWAVITGGANGLGRAFAEVFASHGLNIVFIDRNPIELKYAQSQLKKKYENVTTLGIPNDFSMTQENYQNIENVISELDIGVLVNNIHGNYPHPEFLTDLNNAEDIIEYIIATNIYSCITMTKLVLPIMVKNQRGIIINVCSFTVDIPSPMLAVYAASKVFVEKFTMDLIAEHQHDNITIQCLLPGFLDCRWLRLRAPSLLAPTPERYLECAFPMLGVHERTVGYYIHTIFLGIVHFVHYYFPAGCNYFNVWFMRCLREISLRGYL